MVARSWPTVGLSALLVALVVVVAGCASPELDALKGDPMAEVTFADAPLLSSSEQKAGESMGKPIYAELFRRFDLTDIDDPQRVFDEAVATAQEHGWVASTIPGPVPLTGWWQGKKTLGGYRAVISVGLHESPPGETADLVLDVRVEVME